MDLSPNGDYALLGLADHTAVYFDIKNGGVKRTLGHQARVKAVDLSEDAQFALTGSDAWKTKFWNVETNELLHTIELGNVVDTVALAPTTKKPSVQPAWMTPLSGIPKRVKSFTP
ncbi:hypothetical protein [Aliamphritea spongicola]|nr:hypothetical protein [Aliamphritea spongicola]